MSARKRAVLPAPAGAMRTALMRSVKVASRSRNGSSKAGEFQRSSTLISRVKGKVLKPKWARMSAVEVSVFMVLSFLGIAPVGIDEGAQVAVVGQGAGSLGRRLALRCRELSGTGAAAVGVRDDIDEVKLDETALVKDGQRTLGVEEIAEDPDALAGVAAGDLVVAAVVTQHVVLADATGEARNECLLEPAPVRWHRERPRVLVPSVGRGPAAQALVGGVVVDFVQPVTQPEPEGLGRRVDFGVAVEGAQQFVLDGLFELLHLIF